MFLFTIRQLEVFLRVTEDGSFRRAAEALGISEAAVSNHMRLLEEQLGCALFTRRRGAAITLSAAGELFQTEVRAFVHSGIGIGRRLRAFSTGKTTLRLFVGPHILEDILRPALSQFYASVPEIWFTFHGFANRDEISRALRNNLIDGCLMTVPGEADLHGSILLGTVGLSVFGTEALRRTAEDKGLNAIDFLQPVHNHSGEDREAVMRRIGAENAHVVANFPYHDVGVDMARQGIGALVTLDSIIHVLDVNRELVKIKDVEQWEQRLLLPDDLNPEGRDKIVQFLRNILAKAAGSP